MVSMLIVVCKRCNGICLDILIYLCAGHKFYDLCNRLTLIYPSLVALSVNTTRSDDMTPHQKFQ